MSLCLSLCWDVNSLLEHACCLYATGIPVQQLADEMVDFRAQTRGKKNED